MVSTSSVHGQVEGDDVTREHGVVTHLVFVGVGEGHHTERGEKRVESLY